MSVIVAPAAESRDKVASKALVTASSRSSRTYCCGTAKRRLASGNSSGRRIGSPANTLSRMAQQATLAASGPMLSSEKDSGAAPSSGTRACVGLKPVMPQKADGMRTDPPVSVPSAATAMPSVTDTAAPEDDPPGTRARSCGLPGVP